MSDTENIEADGRHVSIDTAFFEVEVHGDPDDSLDDVKEAAFEAADRAKDDVQELSDEPPRDNVC